MKYFLLIGMMTVVIVGFGCVEDPENGDDPIIERCDDTVIQVWDGEVWQSDFDCSLYQCQGAGVV